ncbi:GlcG/HbpS family heme-binding protein [Sphaerisporangium fuscum]|uniref:GlcG/HbpS family heme-binding protein n=1 Tax=Sphaerisporangium fuscum TaxID=2835868 RepID=UPI001BDD927E|nr:heme-binding protein [Sphaerisporangium fuscum]
MTTRSRTRLVARPLAGLAIMAGTLGAASAVTSPAQAAPAENGRAAQAVVQTDVLSADAALTIADAAMKEAVKGKQRVTVVIVDRSGATRLVLKGDGAGPQTEESARRKAFTAVSFGRTTSELGKSVTGEGPTIADIPGTLFLGGGVPVASGGVLVAGIGVGGAPSGDIDEAIAQAGLKAVTGRLR